MPIYTILSQGPCKLRSHANLNLSGQCLLILVTREVDVTARFVLIQNVLAINLLGHMLQCAIDSANVAVYTLMMSFLSLSWNYETHKSL
jgi:hypothetical protein